jgi:hypothetical protein
VYVEHRRETLEEDRLLRPDQYEIGLAARHVVLLRNTGAENAGISWG